MKNEKIKDSGAREEHSTGAHRDSGTGKGRFDHVPLMEVYKVMNDPVIYNIGEFMETRNVSYLAEALTASLDTIDLFDYDYMVKSLGEEGIVCRELPEERRVQAVMAHMMLEVAKLYEAGGEKYGYGNWKLGMPVNRYIDSGVRHYMKTLRGDIDEPHYRGFIWNLLCAMWTAENIPEMNFKDEPEREPESNK